MTGELLRRARVLIDEGWRPDGYTVGWNHGAAGANWPNMFTCTSSPFFRRAPRRPWSPMGIKQEDNRRPTPSLPGRGLAYGPLVDGESQSSLSQTS